MIGDLLLNPALWGVLLLLGAVCSLTLWLRFKFGRAAALWALFGIWLFLTATAQLLYATQFLDGRFWIHHGFTIAAAIAPLLMFAVGAPDATPRRWRVGGGVIATVLGTGGFLVVGLVTVCAAGIDCL